MFVYSSTNTPMGLTSDQMAAGRNLEFMAVSQNGPGGILRPGAHFSMQIYFNNQGQPFHFQVFTVESDSSGPDRLEHGSGYD